MVAFKLEISAFFLASSSAEAPSPTFPVGKSPDGTIEGIPSPISNPPPLNREDFKALEFAIIESK